MYVCVYMCGFLNVCVVYMCMCGVCMCVHEYGMSLL